MSDVHTVAIKNTSYKVDQEEDGEAYMTSNESEMGLVLLQEWWGLNKQIATQADIFAQQGFKVIVPDLYRGKVGKDNEEATHLMTNLDWKSALRQIDAAKNHLYKQYYVKKVGILGFCMGGALTTASICDLKMFHAASPYYGIPSLDQYDVSKIQCPVLLNFGKNDDMKGFSDAESATKLYEKMQSHQIKAELKIWEDCGHAFMNLSRPEAYNEKASKESIQITSAFFKKHLV